MRSRCFKLTCLEAINCYRQFVEGSFNCERISFPVVAQRWPERDDIRRGVGANCSLQPANI